jgi:hypothetical protein
MGDEDLLSNNTDADILRMEPDDADTGGDNDESETSSDAEFSDETPDDASETDESENDETGTDGKKSRSEKTADDDDGEFSGETDEIGDYSPVPKDQLLKKYPDLYKNFPQIKTTFDREERFTEIFPNIEDAETAAQYQEIFHNFESNIANGDPSHLLDSVKKMDQNTFNKFTGNFLDTLYRVDRDQYNEVLRPVARRLIKYAYGEGLRTQNENLQNAAGYISQLLFGNPNVEQLPDDRKKVQEKDPEREKFEREKAEHNERMYNTALVEVGSFVDKKLDGFLSNIDNDGKLNDYAKKKLITDIKEEIGRRLGKETPLQRTLGNLWQRAGKFGYSPDIKRRIAELYTTRAKQVAPAIAKQLYREATGSGSKPTKKTSPLVPGAGRPSANGNKGRTASSGKTPDIKMIDYGKSSDSDILRGKITLKGK